MDATAHAASDAVRFRVIRNVPETINATFDYLRLHGRTLFKSLLLIAFPPLLLASIGFTWFFGRVMLELFDMYSYGSLDSDAGALLASLFLGGILFLIGTVFLFAVVYAHLRLSDRLPAGSFGVAEVWEETKDLFWMTLGTLLFFSVLASVAGIAFSLLTLILDAIPVIGPIARIFISVAFWTLFLCYFPARYLEGRGVLRSFGRSTQLVQGHWGRALGMTTMLFLILYTLFFACFLPITITAFIIGLNGIDVAEAVENPTVITIVVGVLSVIFIAISQLVSIVPMVGASYFYYSQVERTEAKSLMDDIARIGEPATEME